MALHYLGGLEYGSGKSHDCVPPEGQILLKEMVGLDKCSKGLYGIIAFRVNFLVNDKYCGKFLSNQRIPRIDVLLLKMNSSSCTDTVDLVI